MSSDMFGNVASSYCRICGRALTNPKSVARGIGPICAAKMGLTNGHHKKKKKTHEDDMENEGMDFLHDAPPALEKIVLKRTGDKPGERATNVPWQVKHHSPSGFEWAYGGSGPADLALNIMELYLDDMGLTGKVDHPLEGRRMDTWDGGSCDMLAWQLHQDFKREFIAAAPKEGGELDGDIIREWIQERVREKFGYDPTVYDNFWGYMQHHLDEFERWRDTRETSREVAQAIFEQAATSEEADFIWRDPTPEEKEAVEQRARELSGSDEPLYWGEEEIE